MITITTEAAKRLKNMLNKDQPNNSQAGIRLAVKAGGCSGFSYIPLTVAPKPTPNDNIFLSNEILIFVDHKSLVIVDGTEIDHSSNLLEGFTFNNPKAKSACGCGTSFELKSK